ncbi:MAG: type IX secretion system sortase PorU [Bacteroidota bacterium]|nr:type IX secretion system sortase PorU [Bacteroidota bacterium]MDW8136908.1 type IX secretion system sortase PorU [Bacteroidota bacterium]
MRKRPSFTGRAFARIRFWVSIGTLAGLLTGPFGARSQSIQVQTLSSGLLRLIWQADSLPSWPTGEPIDVRLWLAWLSRTGWEPCYEHSLELPGPGVPQLRLQVAERDPVSVPAAEPASWKAWSAYLLRPEPVGLSEPGMERRRWKAELLFYPFRLEGGRLIRYRRIVVDLLLPEAPSARLQAASENSHLRVRRSVLADGPWYRFGVSRTGIYRIDRALLQSWGINPDNVDARTIRIFGNGGQPLPALAGAPRPADLLEVPTYAVGLEDGRLDAGDYLLFFGQGPYGWRYEADPVTAQRRWQHWIHPFSRETYYFLTFGGAPARRMSMLSSLNEAEPLRPRAFTELLFWEPEIEKAEATLQSGTQWLGPRLDANARTRLLWDRPLHGLVPGSAIAYRIKVAARSIPETEFILRESGFVLGRILVPPVPALSGIDGPAAYEREAAFTLSNAALARSRLELSYNGPANGTGWLDWVSCAYPRQFVAVGDTLGFRSPEGASGVVEFRLEGFSREPLIFDVTEHQDVRWIRPLVGGPNPVFQVRIEPGQIRTFYATAGVFLQPGSATPIPNQNLHGIAEYPDYVLIAPRAFAEPARRLAEHRRATGLRPLVVWQEEILNEFSGGASDPRAIRDYLKFLYDRAPTPEQMPRYVLLLGDGHYDYKELSRPALRNWILTYQSDESLVRERTYTSDDYFGLLDDHEGLWEWREGPSPERLDLAIGRLPVQTLAEAQRVVERIIRYETDRSGWGDWRAIVTFLADDGPTSYGSDYDLHLQNAEMTARRLQERDPAVEIHKLYMSAYEAVSTPLGRRLPQVTRDLLERINQGTLLVNFTGHGGPEGWTHERVFQISDIPRLSNRDRLAVFVTVTCSFGKFDSGDTQSGAEELLVYPDGGAIAVLGTTRVVYTNPDTTTANLGLAVALFDRLFRRDALGRPLRIGDSYLLTKNTAVGREGNSRKFALLGDPALRLGLPERRLRISRINGRDPEQEPLLLRALDEVLVEGEVLDAQGGLDERFSGQVVLTVYDALRRVPVPPGEVRYLREGYFTVRQDRLFRGTATVRGGRFRLRFVVPKDISYTGQPGRLWAYALGPAVDALGATDRVLVGGTNPDAARDTRGPEVFLYLNDRTFVSGGLTNPTPLLIADVRDESGINTTGLGVGHEMLAILNGDERRAIVLNPFYQSKPDSYQEGTITYRLGPLEPGEYELRVRLWDVHNNPGEATLRFVVASSEGLVIRNVLAYPNPMRSSTRFVFEHNRPGEPLDVEIRIYTVTGRLVRLLRQEGLVSAGTLVQIPWDGLDEDLEPLARGVYLYRVRVALADGSARAEHVERLVVLR